MAEIYFTHRWDRVVESHELRTIVAWVKLISITVFPTPVSFFHLFYPTIDATTSFQSYKVIFVVRSPTSLKMASVSVGGLEVLVGRGEKHKSGLH